MNLKLQRKFYRPEYIIGNLFIDDVYFCDTLELPYRDNITNVSCIPASIYPIKMEYSNHFKRKLPHINDVPNRTDIMLHNANFVIELLGCVAVGRNKIKGGLVDSRITSDNLNELLKDKSDITITVYI